MTLRSRRQPFRRPFSAPIFFFPSRRVHSRIHPIRRLWCTGRPFLLLHRRRVLDRFSETRDSLLRSRCLATRRSRRRRAASGRRRSPHRCRRRRRRSSTPILLSRCSPLSRERGLLRRHHLSCVVPASTETTTRERERERERERDVRSFKTPGEGSSTPSSSSSSSSASSSSRALPRENNNALSKTNPILFFLS